MFTSVKLFPSTVSSIFQFFMVFSINFMISLDILYIPTLWNHIKCLFVVNPRHSYIFSSRFALLKDDDQCVVDLLFLLFPCGILSVLIGKVRRLLVKSKSLLWFVPSVFSTTSVGTLQVCCCKGRFLFGVFLNYDDLSFCHPFEFVYFF